MLRDGVAVDLGPFKQRSLLALLLMHANQVVSSDRIREELWGELAGDRENALWVYVSRLRSVLEPDRTGRGESSVLITREPGYLLAVSPSATDVSRFEDAVTKARAAEDVEVAASLLEEALAMWRGDAYSDFVYEDFARAAIDRLVESRVAATELWYDLRLRLGQSRQLVGELDAFARSHPYRERPVAQLMQALYRSGRPAESLRSFDHYRRVVTEELGIEPSPELRQLQERILLHDDTLMPDVRPLSSTGDSDRPNPYRGLYAFEEADADGLFGRNDVVANIIERLEQGQRLVTLVGPSGSGKSSVLRAGVMPKLRKGKGMTPWVVAQMVPGAHPYAELEAALLHSLPDTPASLGQQLEADEAAIVRAVLRILPQGRSRLLLVIDQFEELFTLVDDVRVRRRFLADIVAAIDEPHGRISVILGLRADFYDRPLQHAQFAQQLAPGVVSLTALSAQELEAAAVNPALANGVGIEPALLAQLIADVVDQPGSLPMFQYTLTELYERREGATLSAATYQQMGGVKGAITHRAEELYRELSPEQQVATRQLFLRLVALAADDTWTGRRVPLSEITTLDVDVVALEAVLDRLGKHRLLAFDRDKVSGAAILEVGHEAVLTEWTRLSGWIKESRDDLRRHAAFSAARDEWERSGRDSGYVIAGSRLTEYERWATSGQIQLNAQELEYLGASLAKRAAEVDADSRRMQRETQLRATSRRRLWGLLATITVLAAVAGVYLVGTVLSDDVSVALVYGGDDADAMSGLLALGAEQAADELSIELDRVTPPFTDLADVYRRLAGEGTDLIVVSGSLDLGDAEDVAGDLPNTMFAIVMPGGSPRADNIAAYAFSDEEAGFLAGVAAALKTETDVVGFIGGTAFTDVELRRAGFEAGVAYINPTIKVMARHISASGDIGEAFSRPDLGKAAASALFDDGADIIFHSAGRSGLGIFQAARERTEIVARKHWGIGVDSDQILDVDEQDKDYVLTSVVRKFDVVVYDLITAFVNDEAISGLHLGTLADGAIGFSTRGGHLPAEAIVILEDVERRIISGEIIVPTVPRGELLPPLGADIAHVIAVEHDEDGCRLVDAAPSTVQRGDAVRIDIANEALGTVAVFVYAEEYGSVASLTEVAAKSSAAAYAVIEAGTYVLRCGAATGSEPIELAEIAASSE